MNLCLSDIILRAARNWPDAVAVIEPPHSITYQQLDEKISAYAMGLVAFGLKKGERVGILARNSIDFVTVYFAVSRAGGISVALNYTLDIPELVRQADGCSCSALAVEEYFEEKAKAVLMRTRSIRFLFNGTSRMPQKASCRFPTVKPDDAAAIVYTSGTTSKPLGVTLTHTNLIVNNQSIARYTRLTSSDRVCCVLPLYYIYGLSLVLSHFLVGAAVILENRFLYPNIALETIEQYGATGFAGVSSHYAILLSLSDIKKRKLPSLRYFMQAGDSMPEKITRRLIALFPRKRVYRMYGQTEAAPRLTYLNPALVRRKPTSVGRAIPGVRIKLVNGQGRECRAGETGEILARGKNVMAGYWNNKRETSRALKGGWLHTGDMAYKDRDGDLYIVGRKEEFLKIGGRRVSPQEIETIVREHPSVAEAAAVGVADTILGQRIRLFVSVRSDKTFRKKEIIRYCRRRLPPYKIPFEMVVLKALPKNSLGKIDREKLGS